MSIVFTLAMIFTASVGFSVAVSRPDTFGWIGGTACAAAIVALIVKSMMEEADARSKNSEPKMDSCIEETKLDPPANAFESIDSQFAALDIKNDSPRVLVPDKEEASPKESRLDLKKPRIPAQTIEDNIEISLEANPGATSPFISI